ncbi:MAG: GNAT family N-acetyltransferase [Candidatus Delongbacteria bacterium]|nr:GNAT family N-acetyltransferase [Candidatus Delongbacteria bacterium]MCG2760506.1 GNAT family N-acetyltransferase [Candidatus Delongbacteria bacterium]
MSEIEFRIPSLSDYENVRSIWEDEKTMADVGGIVPIDDTGFTKWFDYMFANSKDRNCYFLIFYEGSCAGEVSFHRFDPEKKIAELNIKVKYEFRSKGIGRKALDHIFSVFFNEWNGLELYDTLWKENPAGIKALKAYGFKEKGIDNEGNPVLYYSATATT